MFLDLSNFAEVDTPQRVLIDWDYAAHGIWKIPSAEALSAPAPRGSWPPGKDAATNRPPRWGDLLSRSLLDALQDWNNTGETLLGPRGDPSGVGPELDTFWALAAELAKRTQQELGPGYEVLYIRPRTVLGGGCCLRPPERTDDHRLLRRDAQSAHYSTDRAGSKLPLPARMRGWSVRAPANYVLLLCLKRRCGGGRRERLPHLRASPATRR